jgi:hypothetical protein
MEMERWRYRGEGDAERLTEEEEVGGLLGLLGNSEGFLQKKKSIRQV